MSDNNPSAEAGTVTDAPLSVDSGADAIAKLFDAPETDRGEEAKQDEATADSDQDAEASEMEDEEPEIDLSEDVEDEASDDEDEDGLQDDEIKGGRFAPDTAKVTLEDGTVITVAELKRNNLFQRDYSRKTQELAEQRRAVEEQASTVSQQVQSLAALTETLNAFGQKYLPTPPEPPTTNDPVRYLNYLKEKERYDAAVAEFESIQGYQQQVRQAEAQRMAMEQQQALAQEMDTLLQRDPFFRDKQKVRAFFEEVNTKGAEYWGLTPEDVAGITSHKAMQILRDAMRYRNAVAKAPNAQKTVQSAPAKAQRRGDPDRRYRDDVRAKTERLRKTGSVEDAAAAIQSLFSRS